MEKSFNSQLKNNSAKGLRFGIVVSNWNKDVTHSLLNKTIETLLNFGTKKSDIFKDNIVTEVNEVVEFYEAEEYHHNYFKNNPNNSYCQIVVSPKIEKFNKGFPSLISK